MSSDPASQVKVEIAHVLFMDIVGYSQLLITQQTEQLETLRRIVRGTEQFRSAEAEGKLLSLPTGDGGALVFRTTPEAPVLCAMEISEALQQHPELRLRMGIHSGPVNAITDLNEQVNIAGAGINIAQRVMDCGDAGHILLSRHVAEDLEHYPRWRPYLHDLGSCEVKHGVRLSVVNCYTDTAGNSALPAKFQSTQSIPTGPRPPPPTVPLARAIGIGALAVIAVLAFLVLPGHWRPNEQAPGGPAEALSIPTKSIAVLPFANLSHDPDNAYFVEGIQDEILTRLSKIRDLKVISRTSTQKYDSAPDNLPDVARRLGVANILEGSVQRSNGQVRVNVQLINTLSQAHLWADTYDRPLNDTFMAESEIATRIAEALHATLTASERAAISKVPTSNPEAYELYLRGRFCWNKRSAADLREAIEYFNRAIAKDPGYALAYAGLADSYLLLANYGGSSTEEVMPSARTAVIKALELDDSLAEAHASRGLLETLELHLEHAISEFQRAIRLKPNFATAHHWLGLGHLSLGHFDQAIAYSKSALELDPLSLIINADFSWTYLTARRLDDAEAQARETIRMDPRFFLAHYYLGAVLELKGNIGEAIPEFQKSFDLNGDPYSLAMLGQAYARNGQRGEAEEVLARLNEEAKTRYVAPYALAVLYLGLGDEERALDELERAYQRGDTNRLFGIKVDPFLDELRGQARFQALLRRVVGPQKYASNAKRVRLHDQDVRVHEGVAGPTVPEAESDCVMSTRPYVCGPGREK
jgi:TolB-like protein/Tfp pilus assembly protein PilF